MKAKRSAWRRQNIRDLGAAAFAALVSLPALPGLAAAQQPEEAMPMGTS